jgi:hypothetical protein
MLNDGGVFNDTIEIDQMTITYLQKCLAFEKNEGHPGEVSS